AGSTAKPPCSSGGRRLAGSRGDPDFPGWPMAPPAAIGICRDLVAPVAAQSSRLLHRAAGLGLAGSAFDPESPSWSTYWPSPADIHRGFAAPVAGAVPKPARSAGGLPPSAPALSQVSAGLAASSPVRGS